MCADWPKESVTSLHCSTILPAACASLRALITTITSSKDDNARRASITMSTLPELRRTPIGMEVARAERRRMSATHGVRAVHLFKRRER